MGFTGLLSQRGKSANTRPSGSTATPTICGSRNCATTCRGELAGATGAAVWVESVVAAVPLASVAEGEEQACVKMTAASRPVVRKGPAAKGPEIVDMRELVEKQQNKPRSDY